MYHRNCLINVVKVLSCSVANSRGHNR